MRQLITLFQRQRRVRVWQCERNKWPRRLRLCGVPRHRVAQHPVSPNIDRVDMQRPNHRGQQGELESAMETLNISRDNHQSPPQPQPQSHSQPQPPLARASREASSSRDSDQHHHENPTQAGSSGSQHSAPKTSHEEWYLKSIDFTSPSGVTRTYNVITQNYNGCVFCH